MQECNVNCAITVILDSVSALANTRITVIVCETHVLLVDSATRNQESQ